MFAGVILISPLLYVGILVSAVTALFLHSIVKSNPKSKHPPGPPAPWFFGNNIPISFAYREYERLVAEYGPVFSLKQGTNILVVIGRYQAAVDIMEKQGAYLADRPRSISAGETLSGGMRLLLLGAGDRLNKFRKEMMSQFRSNIISTYDGLQMTSAKNLVLDILADPQRHQDHARRFAGSLIMSLSYGKATPTSYLDPEVQAVGRCLRRLGEAARPGSWKVEAYPFLRFIPGYLRPLSIAHQEELELFRSQLDVVREKMAKGEALPSFGKSLIERQREHGLSDDEMAYLTGSMFGAGFETTVASISTIIMAAACFPREQAKVQEQLLSVLGRDRPPTFKDEQSLPEVTAFILETYRWRPVSANGFPHRATRDIVWGDYVIPKGAHVLGCHWSIGRDPLVFPNPEAFNPQRWLDEGGQLRKDLKFPNYGFGRRICPGQHVADRSMFINAVLLLWAFDVRQDVRAPIDTEGFSDGIISCPLPFSVRFTPRLGDPDSLRKALEGYGL